MKKIISILLSAVFVLTLFASCGDPEEKILGKWETTVGDTTGAVEFLEDGTLLFYTNGEREEEYAEYTVLDESRIRLSDPEGYDESQIVDYEISGSTLRFNPDGNDLISFEKVN